MQQENITIKARQIRDVIRYIEKFKNSTVVIYIEDEILDSPLFSCHIRDIAILHQAGLRVIIVPGAKTKIDEILTAQKINWSYSNNIRITSAEAIPQIKSAAFDVSNSIMTKLAAHKITAVVGNWVKARGIGVINGIDYGTAGNIEKLNIEAINKILEDGFISIFPCIGWSAAGKPYNISSVNLAQEVAINLKADKLFYLINEGQINSQNFTIPEGIGLSPEGNIPAMDLAQLENFLSHNKTRENSRIYKLLEKTKYACSHGVSRSHIINASIDGVLPCEIFSELGSGTMIYSNSYGKIRHMTTQDIPSVLFIAAPFVEQKILLPLTDIQLSDKLEDFIVYEIDGGIRACAALHIYTEKQAEIASVAVDKNFSHLGIGPLMINNLIEKAKSSNIESVFILTTQTADWFENLGFIPDDITTLPLERKSKWSPQRGSKVFRLKLK